MEYTYTAIAVDDLTATDLREEAATTRRMGMVIQAYRIDIAGSAERAEALEIGKAGRYGISWGADATWGDASGVNEAIELWANDPDEWEARS